jgi:hypothetical protein
MPTIKPDAQCRKEEERNATQISHFTRFALAVCVEGRCSGLSARCADRTNLHLPGMHTMAPITVNETDGGSTVSFQR